MGTSRLDNFSDSAWLLIAAATIILMVKRVLNTLEKLMEASSCTLTQSMLITNAAIMVLVGIAAATIALPDKWVQSIVQAMFVGVGFALKEILSEVLAGLSIMKLKNANVGNIIVLKKSDEKFTIVAANLFSVVLRDAKTQWHVPWTTLQNQWISFQDS